MWLFCQGDWASAAPQPGHLELVIRSQQKQRDWLEHRAPLSRLGIQSKARGRPMTCRAVTTVFRAYRRYAAFNHCSRVADGTSRTSRQWRTCVPQSRPTQ